jgi:hypothetical protein
MKYSLIGLAGCSFDGGNVNEERKKNERREINKDYKTISNDGTYFLSTST